jgi:hypothetical protein
MMMHGLANPKYAGCTFQHLAGETEENTIIFRIIGVPSGIRTTSSKYNKEKFVFDLIHPSRAVWCPFKYLALLENGIPHRDKHRHA